MNVQRVAVNQRLVTVQEMKTFNAGLIARKIKATAIKNRAMMMKMMIQVQTTTVMMKVQTKTMMIKVPTTTMMIKVPTTTMMMKIQATMMIKNQMMMMIKNQTTRVPAKSAMVHTAPVSLPPTVLAMAVHLRQAIVQALPIFK